METVNDSHEPADEERQIVAELKRGNRERLGVLIDRYGEDLMRYLTVLMGDSMTAEDVFQTSWVKVMERIGQFDAKRALAPWLFRVARNCAYDTLRRRRRWWSRSSHDDAASYDTGVSEASSPLENLVTTDLTNKLLSQLQPKQRELIWLRFYEELSYQEMAERCGSPLGTVKSGLSRALHSLTTLYRELEEASWV
jgi:RNA polymerase sigma-70 factor (ECF subfamily)